VGLLLYATGNGDVRYEPTVTGYGRKNEKWFSSSLVLRPSNPVFVTCSVNMREKLDMYSVDIKVVMELWINNNFSINMVQI